MMEFSEQQVRQLKAKLKPRYVKTRQAEGALLHYVEGWHAIAEANRILDLMLGTEGPSPPVASIVNGTVGAILPPMSPRSA